MTIIWMPEALANLEDIVNYLESEWTEDQASTFIRRLDHLVHLIAKGGVSFQRSIVADCHRVPITPHNVLYYKIAGDKLEILSIWDSRRDPDTNPNR